MISKPSEELFDDSIKPFNRRHTRYTPLLFRQRHCLLECVSWTLWMLTMIIPWTMNLTMMYASDILWSCWF